MPLSARTTAAIVSLALLAGCAGFSQSRLNPRNWFGPRQLTVQEFSIQRAADPRPLIAQIITVDLEPLPSGGLLRATGRAETQGYWFADLIVGEVDDKGTLTVEFRAYPAPQGAAVSTPRSREITAAVSLRADTLAAAKRIRVRGAKNAEVVRARP